VILLDDEVDERVVVKRTGNHKCDSRHIAARGSSNAQYFQGSYRTGENRGARESPRWAGAAAGCLAAQRRLEGGIAST
jgi:hypothetical protein